MHRILVVLCLFSLLVLSSPVPLGAQPAEEGAASIPQATTVIVKVEKTTVRSSASSNAKSVTTIRQFTPVEVLDRGGDWIKIRTKGGTEGFVPGGDLHTDSFVSVKGKIANIRSGTNAKDPIVFSLKEHYPLKVVDRQDDRVKISDYEGDTGWIHENFLKTDKYVIVHNLPTVNVREAPNAESALRFKADKGYIFQVLGEQDGWLRVRCADGDEGWCSAKIVWGYLNE